MIVVGTLMGPLQTVNSGILVSLTLKTPALNIKAQLQTLRYFQQQMQQLDINCATFLTFSSLAEFSNRYFVFTASLLPACPLRAATV